MRTSELAAEADVARDPGAGPRAWGLPGGPVILPALLTLALRLRGDGIYADKTGDGGLARAGARWKRVGSWV